ncbi:hypothetical protein Bca52824_050575 [Brassica carinata]|uniref:Uncharacterized protein n=1 Tax=Brassica carinata TaxID=52824 RepID=A0A8X7R2P5_BRACI|nr:hypothetical protein Bca52824_050575 [Brassica carinata]
MWPAPDLDILSFRLLPLPEGCSLFYSSAWLGFNQGEVEEKKRCVCIFLAIPRPWLGPPSGVTSFLSGQPAFGSGVRTFFFGVGHLAFDSGDPLVSSVASLAFGSIDVHDGFLSGSVD